MFLQGMQAVSVLHNSLGSPSAPQAAPAPTTKAKTFQKAKSLLSFRQQGSTAASSGSNRSSRLPAAYPALPPGGSHQHPVEDCGILVMVWGVHVPPYPLLSVIVCDHSHPLCCCEASVSKVSGPCLFFGEFFMCLPIQY